MEKRQGLLAETHLQPRSYKVMGCCFFFGKGLRSDVRRYDAFRQLARANLAVARKPAEACLSTLSLSVACLAIF